MTFLSIGFAVLNVVIPFQTLGILSLLFEIIFVYFVSLGDFFFFVFFVKLLQKPLFCTERLSNRLKNKVLLLITCSCLWFCFVFHLNEVLDFVKSSQATVTLTSYS